MVPQNWGFIGAPIGCEDGRREMAAMHPRGGFSEREQDYGTGSRVGSGDRGKGKLKWLQRIWLQWLQYSKLIGKSKVWKRSLRVASVTCWCAYIVLEVGFNYKQSIWMVWNPHKKCRRKVCDIWKSSLIYQFGFLAYLHTRLATILGGEFAMPWQIRKRRYRWQKVDYIFHVMDLGQIQLQELWTSFIRYTGRSHIFFVGLHPE